MNKRRLMRTIFLIVMFTIALGCSNETKENENNNISEVEKMDDVTVIINDKKYLLNLENNETAREFILTLPKSFTMNELNGNEKYVYLNETFSINASNPETIHKGDVMLYGNNCLVIFYKTFTTSYSYTKIGHIDNLEDLGDVDIKVKLEK